MSLDLDKPIVLSLNAPLFSYGADQSVAEFRAPSVRGQLRQWMRWLGYPQDTINKLFGCADGNDGKPSRVVVRTDYSKAKAGAQPSLPHKNWAGNNKQALQEDADCLQLYISLRHAPKMATISKDSAEYKALQRCVEAWVLMGSIGLRSTRGAGSISCDSLPCMSSPQAYLQRCRELLQQLPGAKLRVALLEGSYSKSETARGIVSDGLAEAAFANCNRPMGGIKPRKTSELKFKILYVDGGYYILCLRPDTLNDANYKSCAATLEKSDKRLGRLLNSAVFQ